MGEAPGADEVIKGEPFVGRAGDVLWAAVAAAGLLEDEVFIVNSVACRPFNPVRPAQRAPSSHAVKACHERLVGDIAHPRPVIVALGATAVRAVTERRGLRVTKMASGTEIQTDWGPVVPTLHPAYVLRGGLNSAEKERLVEDLKHARRVAGV